MSEDRVKRLGDGWFFVCPGCGENHRVTDSWTFNGDTVRPTIRPSILVTWRANPDAIEGFEEWRKERRCHSFVTDGKIAFLSDCTHAHAGETMDLPPMSDWPDWAKEA